MKLKSLSITLATTALVALSAPAIAEDKTGTNVTTEGTGEPGGTATLALAYELYDLGVASGDALTVLTAAKLAASVATEAGGEVKKTTEGTAAADDAEGDAAAPPKADEMFAMALELAGEDEALKGLIADAQVEGTRGAIGGAQLWESKLPKGMYDVYEIAFYGNSYAEVAVVGDGDANLDILITDENGNVICYDVSPSDQVYCDWVPAWDGYFYVTVENTGNSRNTYYLLTN
jgi:hypothetical protein